MEEAYREDLAFIHDTGFGGLARGAAAFLLEELPRRSFDRGLVIDLGCGSGITVEQLSARGFDLLGIDAAMARARGREWLGSHLNGRGRESFTSCIVRKQLPTSSGPWDRDVTNAPPATRMGSLPLVPWTMTASA
jgi:hypothetical protein